jgi:bacterioferritin-associated ferredoxin
MSCRRVRNPLSQDPELTERLVYVCNCNGLRERDVRSALEQGAARPAEVFRRCASQPQCAKCICDIRRMIQAQRDALRYAAE